MSVLAKDELFKLYIEEDLNINQISQKLGKSYSYVKKQIVKYGITKAKSYNDPTWLSHLYIEKNLSTIEIAKLAGVSDPTIASALRRFGIKKDQEVLQVARLKKASKTNLEKYGVEHSFQSEEVKEKIKETTLERYGVANPMQNKVIRGQAQETNKEKYGVQFPAQAKEIQKKILKTKSEKGLVSFVEGEDTISSLCLKNNVPYVNLYRIIREKNLSTEEALNYIRNYDSPANYLEKWSSEKLGLEFYNKAFDPEKYPNLRYKPDFKINHLGAINVDGLYWHSEANNKDMWYHFKLRKDFEDNGLKIFQFREDEIFERIEIVKSIIDNYLGQSQKVYARKCSLVKLESSQASQFFEKNHLMGAFNAPAFGLIWDEKLVMAASYKIYQDKIKIERLCSQVGHSIVGGASKLINKIRMEDLNKPIHYWADLRYGTGNYLEGLGFKKIRDTLGFKWTDKNKTFNRLQCRANMDKRGLSQAEQAEEWGWYKIWDAGQRLWILG